MRMHHGPCDHVPTSHPCRMRHRCASVVHVARAGEVYGSQPMRWRCMARNRCAGGVWLGPPPHTAWCGSARRTTAPPETRALAHTPRLTHILTHTHARAHAQNTCTHAPHTLHTRSTRHTHAHTCTQVQPQMKVGQRARSRGRVVSQPHRGTRGQARVSPLRPCMPPVRACSARLVRAITRGKRRKAPPSGLVGHRRGCTSGSSRSGASARP